MANHNRIYLLLLFFGLGVNGCLQLGLLLLPPSPAQTDMRFWIQMVILPYLGILGLWGWSRHRHLQLPWSIGALTIGYVILLTFWANSFYIGLADVVARLPAGSAEIVPLALFGLTLASIIYILRQEY